MLGFDVKRGRTFGAFNFDAYQVYVCELERKNGEHRAKGLALLHAASIWEVPFKLTREEASRVWSFCAAVRSGELPTQLIISGSSSNLWTKFRLTIKRKKQDEVGEIVYIGHTFLGSCLSGAFNRVVISEHSLRNFEECVSAVLWDED